MKRIVSNVSNLQLLYEDNHLIAINKRIGDLVQGDKTKDPPLSEIVKDYLKLKYKKPGAVFLGVTHRLDRPTSGIVIFAKTSKALKRMNQLFQDKKINKDKKKVEEILTRNKTIQEGLQKEIDKFAKIGSKCPYCESKITKEHLESLESERKEKFAEIKKILKKSRDDLEKIDSSLEKQDALIENHEDKISELDEIIPDLEDYEKKLNDSGYNLTSCYVCSNKSN